MSNPDPLLHRLTLRDAGIGDLDVLRRWDEDPDVVASDPHDEWAWSRELPRVLEWRQQWMAEVDGHPIGFIQVIDPAREESRYWGDCAEGFRAIDVWIGDPAWRGRGFGSAMMRLALARCFADPTVHAVLVDPLASNERAVRFYERLGFVSLGPRRFGDDECLVHILERQRWSTIR